MVVILIISILIVLGNFWDISQRREKARMEELAVQLTALIDQEKTYSLLGKTEWGAIVRKRKIELSFTSNILTYKSFADLAEDNEGTYCSFPATCNDAIMPWWTWTNTPLSTKVWQFFEPSLTMAIYDCDTTNPPNATLWDSVTIELTGDTMSFANTLASKKHLVIMVHRNIGYREIHIDRRTGVTYEKEGTGATPSLCQ